MKPMQDCLNPECTADEGACHCPQPLSQCEAQEGDGHGQRCSGAAGHEGSHWVHPHSKNDAGELSYAAVRRQRRGAAS